MGYEEARALRNSFRGSQSNKSEPRKNTAQSRFDKALSTDDVTNFTVPDWHRYITLKCKIKGVRYSGSNVKSNAVLKSALTNFHPNEIRLMIDFIFDSGQDKFDYKSNVVMALSKSWLDYTYNTSKIWDGVKDSYKSDIQQKGASKRKAVLKKRESNHNRVSHSKEHHLGGGIHL
jgi:hypothetical protein